MKILFIMFLFACTSFAQHNEVVGSYFSKKKYQPMPLAKYESVKDKLPSPVYDEEPLFVESYWMAWHLAFLHFYEPPPHSGFVSQFIDAAFNQNIFLWDTSFMTMFCNYAATLVPGICSLDNFYAKQHEDGEICREIVRATGLDFRPWVNTENKALFSRWGWRLNEKAEAVSVDYRDRAVPLPNPVLTLDALNNPMLSWAELEYFHLTGDTARLALVKEPLVRYYRALKKYLRQGNGLYVTDWASMDNSPRNPYLDGGGQGIDISAQMVLFARNLAEICDRLRSREEAEEFRTDANQISDLINEKMWDPQAKFYFDLTLDGKRAPVKTIAAFWTLLAGVADPEQVSTLVAELRNPMTFGRLHPVPTCSADEAEYCSFGGYWRGSVWAPTNTMVLRGLERNGQYDLAHEIALKHVRAVAEVFRKSGTIWENYAPDAIEPGRHTDSSLVGRDFVGWSGIGPIMHFLDYVIGIRADASRNEITWRVTSTRRCGCDRFRFNGHVLSLLAEPDGGRALRILVVSDGQFRLNVVYRGIMRVFDIHEGVNDLRQ